MRIIALLAAMLVVAACTTVYAQRAPERSAVISHPTVVMDFAFAQDITYRDFYAHAECPEGEYIPYSNGLYFNAGVLPVDFPSLQFGVVAIGNNYGILDKKIDTIYRDGVAALSWTCVPDDHYASEFAQHQLHTRLAHWVLPDPAASAKIATLESEVAALKATITALSTSFGNVAAMQREIAALKTKVAALEAGSGG